MGAGEVEKGGGLSTGQSDRRDDAAAERRRRTGGRSGLEKRGGPAVLVGQPWGHRLILLGSAGGALTLQDSGHGGHFSWVPSTG